MFVIHLQERKLFLAGLLRAKFFLGIFDISVISQNEKNVIPLFNCIFSIQIHHFQDKFSVSFLIQVNN